MGINNLSASSINEFTSLSAQPIPNVPVTIQAYSPNGWTAGDYLYNSASGVVGPPTGNASAGGPIVTLQATNLTVSGGLVSGNQVLNNPLATTITYTGASVSPDAQIFNNQINTNSVNGNESKSICSMTNGNLAVGFFETSGAQPGYYFAIYDQAGNNVVAKTFITNITSTNYNYINIVALAEGGFGYAYYNDDQRLYLRIYTETGTLVTTTSVALASNAVTNYGLYCNRAIQTADGRLTFTWLSSAYICYARFNNQANGYTALTASRIGGQSYSNSLQSYALYPLPSNHVNYPNGFVITNWNADYGTTGFVTFASNGSSSATGTQPTTMYDGMDVMRCQDGTYVAVYGNSGASLLCGKPTINPNGSLQFPSTTTITNSFHYTSYSLASIIPMEGSGYAIFFTNQSTYRATYRRSNTTGSGLTFGSEITLPSTFAAYPYNGTRFVCGTNAGIYSCYLNNSGYTSYLGYSTQTLTNGTVYTATALTPPKYTFLGIAQQTTTAGSVGNVIVNGNAIANSNMPDVSGTVYFDSTQTNMFGNKGYVTGRNFVLKGLE